MSHQPGDWDNDPYEGIDDGVDDDWVRNTFGPPPLRPTLLLAAFFGVGVVGAIALLWGVWLIVQEIG